MQAGKRCAQQLVCKGCNIINARPPKNLSPTRLQSSRGRRNALRMKACSQARLFTSLFGDASEKTECKQSVPQKCCLCHCIFNGMNHRMRGRAHHRAHCLSRRSTKIAIAPPGTPGDFGRSLRSPKIARSAAGF